MEFGDKGFPQFSGPGKGKTEHRSESLDTGSARLRDGQVDLPSPSLPTRFALNPQAIPTPQPNIQVKDGMLIAELSVLDLVVKAEDPAAHPEKIWEAPTVSLGIQSFTGTFHPEWSQDLNPHDCACLSDFFRILSDRALAKLPGEAPSREVEEPKIHQREHDDRFVILDQKGTPFWWASFDNEAEARLAWDHFVQPPKPIDLSTQPKWHVERLQAFADLVARMTTDEEMGGDMSGDDAVMALGELIASARGLAAPPHAIEVKVQRAKLVEVVTAMLAEETDLRTRDNEYRSRRGWYGCTEDFSVTAAREALDLAMANPAPTPPEALAQRDRLLDGAKALLPDLGQLLFRYNVSRKAEGKPPLDEAPCFVDARAIIQRAENETLPDSGDTTPSTPEN